MKPNSLKKCFAIAVAGVLGLSTQATQASIVVDWTGVDGFNDAAIVFTGFVADTLTAVNPGDSTGTGPASAAFFHDHLVTGGKNVRMDIKLDGVWTNIFSTQTDGSNSAHSLSEIGTPISFTSGTVSGIRFTSDPNDGKTFHNFFTPADVAQFSSILVATNFTFERGGGTIPEPTTALIWSMLAGLGMMTYRRRR